MDRSQSRHVIADGIRDAYSDLFAVNTKANELSATDVKNKLRTLYAGKKTNNVIDRIAKTFTALCEYADFSKPATATPPVPKEADDKNEERPGTQETRSRHSDGCNSDIARRTSIPHQHRAS